ncbi:MAG: hypothetical protein ACT4NV_14840 [Rhodoferax sp.]
MGAHLQLVSPSVTTLVIQPDAPQPRVFTPPVLERLAQLTHAERELRALGLQVVWSKLAGPRPQVHIHRDGVKSLAPLLDRMGPRSFHKEGGCTVVSGDFEGVILSWLEAQT